MNGADGIHFSLKGMRKDQFEDWLRKGHHRFVPIDAGAGWTNHELYEALVQNSLRGKTTFYDDTGERTNAPNEWLVLT